MPQAKTIHLRAFELSAGPKTARLVTVSLDKSIADVYAHLRSVLRLDAPLSSVTFHKTHDKKIDTTPLPATAPIGTLGLVENDIFIVRQGSRARSVAREVDNHHRLREEDGADFEPEDRDQHPTAHTIEATAPPALHETDETPANTVDKELGRDATVATSFSPTVDAEGVTNTQHSKLCMATDAQRIESYRQQFAQHSHVTQAFVLKVFQLLAVLSHASPIAPLAAPHRGPAQAAVTMRALHRELLLEFCRRVGLPPRQVDHLLRSGTHGMEAVYEALYYCCAEIPLQNTVVSAKVTAFLEERLPQLLPAARMISLLHAGHEAEYLELALLRLRGQTPTAMTWLCLKDSTALAQGRDRRCYFSTIAGFSQATAPAHVAVAEISVLEAAELDSCCVAWGLNNTAYRGHLLPLSCWLWSRLVASMMTGNDDAPARLCELLTMYSECEASLNWTG